MEKSQSAEPSGENNIPPIEQLPTESNEFQKSEIGPLSVGREYEGYSEEGMKEDLENARELASLVDNYTENLSELEKRYLTGTSTEVVKNGLSMVEQLRTELDNKSNSGKLKSVKDRNSIYQKFHQKYSELKLKGEILGRHEKDPS